MNINVYLPEEIGQRAKVADINFSKFLRYAVEQELHRQEAMGKLLKGSTGFRLELRDEQGREYVGTFTGTEIANGVYLTDDERVLVHKMHEDSVVEIVDPEENLRDWLDEDSYRGAMHALGFKPTVGI